MDLRYFRIISKAKLPENLGQRSLILGAFDLDSSPLGLSHQQVEFIGDLVLSVIVHRLTLRRGIHDWWNHTAELVSNDTLGKLIESANLDKEIIGEGPSWRRNKLLANVFEALVGYLYLGSGNLEGIQNWLVEVWGFDKIVERYSRRSLLELQPLEEQPILDTELRYKLGLDSPFWNIIPDRYLEWALELSQVRQLTGRSLQSDLLKSLPEADIWANSAEASIAYQAYGESLFKLAFAENLLERGSLSMTQLSRITSSENIQKMIQGSFYEDPRLLFTVIGVLDWYLQTYTELPSFQIIKDWLEDLELFGV